MSKNASFFRTAGAVLFAKGEKMPLGDAKSWQEKAVVAGWIEAQCQSHRLAAASAIVNKSYVREQRKMDAILAKGRAKLHSHQVSVMNSLSRAERRATMLFVSHNIVRKAA